ncbi:tail tip assembly protein K [Salmonella phage F115]|uniref:Tail tip assembly protein K n=1 Tax=Salmonella phage F61 TaxID=2982033 RepID=A0A977WMM0_9CAUD|nr:tail tip assembly protein K [Salmonella phage F115]UXM05394.1 tail tip assembly protein K [Salmonella phage F61]
MINAKIKLEIMRHANDVYPNECCGLVTQKSRVQKYHRIDNVSKEPEKHFEMDATQYAEIEADDAEIIAIVHSHTGEGATTIPSAHDLCMCDETGVTWVIVSIPEGDMRFIEPQSRPLIGRPWSLGAYDCWGLVMAWHKEQGVILNDFRKPYEWWKPEYGENLYQDNYLKEGFVETGEPPKRGDMIIMQLQAPVWNHSGIYLGNNQLLHHAFGKLSRVDLYSGWYQEHTTMICRHKDLKNE